MARRLRQDYAGAWHHVMHRGARRAPIFKLTTDCQGFLDILEVACERTGLEVHAYSLMPNHYHLLIRSPLANLSEGMQYLNSTYTLWLNKRHRWDGPVFRGRFRSELVDKEEYLRVLFAYIHLNPLRASLVPRLHSEAWTSHRVYLGKEERPPWLQTEFFTDLFGSAKKLHAFVLAVHQGKESYPDDFDPETGMFARRAIAGEGITRTAQRKKMQQARRSHARHQDPDAVIRRVCRMTGARPADLLRVQRGPGANPARRLAIWALNRSTGLSQRQIGERLDASYHQVTRLLSRIRGEEPREPLRTWIEEWLADE